MKLPAIMPPSLCADVFFYFEIRRTPRDAYKILGKYLNVSIPRVLVDTKKVQEHSRQNYGDPEHVNGFYNRPSRTIYLRKSFRTRTAIHEFFHHLSNERKTRYDDSIVRDYAKEVIYRARLMLEVR